MQMNKKQSSGSYATYIDAGFTEKTQGAISL